MSKLYPSVGIDVDKFWWSAGMFGNNEMTFGTIGHNLHKMRRAAFAKFLSPAYIRKLEPVLRDLVNTATSKISNSLHAGGTVNLVHVYSALTQDIITEYCFSFSRNCLQQPNFAPHYYDWMQIQCAFSPVIKQFPWLLPLLNKLPDWWVKYTNESAWLIRVQEAEYLQQVRSIMQGGDKDRTSHVTVFHEILNDPNLPASEKGDLRMMAEAESLVGAGTLTSAHMLSLTSFVILTDPEIQERLCAELEAAMPDPESSPPQSAFESLAYLNAVMDEGFRMSYGSMHHLSRSHPNNTLEYISSDGMTYIIPPGTPVGYSSYLLHRHPDIFPDPDSFKPERWLGLEPAVRQKMRAYLNNFGRSSRQCVGMRLAYAELYLTLGYVFRRLGRKLEVVDTLYERDIKFVQDYFIPASSKESRGVRVVLKRPG